jgi:hypothetical protein
VALELTNKPAQKKSLFSIPVYIGLTAIVAGGVLFYFVSKAPVSAPEIPLTAEARAYVPHLKLEDVTIQANETYVKQLLVEIQGKITNAGDKPLDTVEIYCIFSDSYNQLVLRKRVPIVGGKMGGLKPGETKSFRLPFDDLPDSWNQAAPRLVIAGIKFS